MNIFKYFKKPENPLLIDKQHAKFEDVTYVRNIQERLASLEIGQTFGVATRTGMHVFKKTEIRTYEEK